MPTKKSSQPRCPKCGEPVFRAGTLKDRGSPGEGKTRYAHHAPQRATCHWHGTQPIGVDDDQKSGIDLETSKALRSQIIAQRSKRVTYVVTSAQNATPVHSRGLVTLLNYCKVTGAQLLVIPYRYKNPTSVWSAKAKQSDWWADELKPYLISDRVALNKHLVLLADIMTQPTGVRPLDGFETLTGAQSAIIGHPKLELTTVPTPQARLPKILTTTGSITKRNYIPSKAGKKAEHHHTFGACAVEIDGTQFHLRQLNMRHDGSFCDLLWEYDGEEVRKYDRVPALVMGDTHVEVIDPNVVKATFTNLDSIVNVLEPEQLVWHDVHDGTAVNHHEKGRAFHDYVRMVSGRGDVEAELDRTFKFIDDYTPLGTENVIVASNHHDFLARWAETTDPRRDPGNAVFWAETYLAVLKSKETTWTPAGVTVQDAFAYWGRRKLKSIERTTFLRRDQSWQIRGIETGHHGDIGLAGTRGSRAQYRKIGVKSIIGHTHAPGIMDGAYQVGTSSRLNLTYTAGSPSGWLHTHAVIYPNGKRSLINVIGDRWNASATLASLG
jgi:hypothetical protein